MANGCKRVGVCKVGVIHVAVEYKSIVVVLFLGVFSSRNNKGLCKLLHKPFLFKTQSVVCFCLLVFFVHVAFSNNLYQLFYCPKNKCKG